MSTVHSRDFREHLQLSIASLEFLALRSPAMLEAAAPQGPSVGLYSLLLHFLPAPRIIFKRLGFLFSLAGWPSPLSIHPSSRPLGQWQGRHGLARCRPLGLCNEELTTSTLCTSWPLSKQHFLPCRAGLRPLPPARGLLMKQVNRRFILAAHCHSPLELAHSRTEETALYGRCLA